MTSHAQHPSRRAQSQGLRSPGLFARFPGIGLAMFLFGSLIFGWLAHQLQARDAALPWEMALAKTFRAVQGNAPWSWMEDMLFGTFLGREVVVLIGTILALYFLHKHLWRELALVVIGLGGGAWIGYVLSHYFDRPRPVDHLDVLVPLGPSFPSGSALAAVLCYGLLAYLLFPRMRSSVWKGLVLLLSTLVIAVAAASSLLFGTHHASDVIAGLALGLAWAGLVFPLVEKIVPAEERIEAHEDVENRIGAGGLRVPGRFKSRPVAAIALILLSSLAFALVACKVQAGGPLVQLDQRVYRDLLARAKEASPVVNDIMLFGFFVGKQCIQLIVLALSLYFLWRRYWLELVILQVATQGGGLIKNLVMDQISRPRPPEQLGLVITTLSSFPSGHTLGTLICYGFLAYLLVPKMPSPFWKWMLSLAILLLILFEGLSRIFYGNHYLSDVLAGYLLGIAWLGFVLTLGEIIFIKREKAAVSSK